MWCLQIIHNPDDGGQNVIEMQFEQRHSAEAEQRRHGRQPHRDTRCETYLLMWEDAHGTD